MKRETRMNLLILLMVVAGLGVMFFPTASDMYARWQMSREIAQYNSVAEAEPEDYSAYWTAAEDYNRRLAEGGIFSIGIAPEERAEVEQLLNPLGTGMMGYVDIPKIDVHLPVYQGIEEKALQSGAGYWPGTSLPTGGAGTHCAITAHNGLVKAKMFTDLYKLEIGDTFSLSILDRVLTYEVDQILTTLPEDIEPLQIVPGEDYVTLYTCTPTGINTHRLLVRGHRVETPAETAEAGEAEQTGPSGFQLGLNVSPELLWAVGAVLAASALAGGGFLLWRRRGRYVPRRLSRGEETPGSRRSDGPGGPDRPQGGEGP